MKNDSIEFSKEEAKYGRVDTQEHEITEYADAKQNTEMLEKINFNTIEDDQDDDPKNSKMPLIEDQGNNEVDLSAQEIEDHRKTPSKFCVISLYS